MLAFSSKKTIIIIIINIIIILILSLLIYHICWHKGLEKNYCGHVIRFPWIREQFTELILVTRPTISWLI